MSPRKKQSMKVSKGAKNDSSKTNPSPKDKLSSDTEKVDELTYNSLIENENIPTNKILKKNLMIINELVTKRIQKDYKLKNEINGIKNSSRLLESLDIILLSPNLVSRLGNALQDLPIPNFKPLYLFNKNSNSILNLKHEIRGIALNLKN